MYETRGLGMVGDVVHGLDSAIASESDAGARGCDAEGRSEGERLLTERAWPALGLGLSIRACVAGAALLSGVGGLVLGGLWGPLAGVGGVLVGGGLASLAVSRWAVRPLERLIDRLELTACNPTPELVERLPLDRRDELGELSRAMARVCRNAIRKGNEAQQLRRTMDQRVRTATRKATNRLQKQTLRDPMTDLGNRRFLDEQGPTLFEATASGETRLLCLALDLDHFKQLNDTMGHAAGDDVLVFLGSLIRATLRDSDMAVRTGGDEFLILMPGAPAERGVSYATQLRALFTQQTALLTKGGPEVGLSVGIAERVADGVEDFKGLLALADERLYAAKRGGRGRSVSGAA
ncbi:diguanylate cyclase [Mucisphaera sp.]|uniref:GGDEF domain-containing protein n=1 Tax=Mucisphaera sp. TaxID=2913024 RepID=UPI003D0EF15E